MTHDETILALPEPPTRALIACQIQSGFGDSWVERTYEARRAADGLWSIDFGEGYSATLHDWHALLGWLASLRPRNVEMLAHD